MVIVIKKDVELMQALAIRRVVFIEEQGVPESIELDEHDVTSQHFLASLAGLAVGTGRLRVDKEGRCKLERIATLRHYRKMGVGSGVLMAMEDYLRKRGETECYLNAQSSATKFYETRGYAISSEVFQEANIPHVRMTKNLLS